MTAEHVHVRNRDWTGAAATVCRSCGLHVQWRDCCDSVDPTEHIPGCAAFRKRFPVGSRLGRKQFVDDDGSTWGESEP